jgi:hypothetical protein
MANNFYIFLNEYPSIDLAGAAIYSFLKKYYLYNDAIFVVYDDISKEDKNLLTRIYYKLAFKKFAKDFVIDGKNISQFDSTFTSEQIQSNVELLKDFEDWKTNYSFRNNIAFPKHLEDSDKYIVFTCAKGENDYIVEWVEHYLNLEFDKIIICDNNDDDSLLGILAEYIDCGRVEIFDCRGFTEIQERAFQMFCEEGNYKWCAYFDCDEFLELGVYSSIKEYTGTKTEDCLAFNWVMYGSDGQLDKKDIKLSERFKKPSLPLSSIYNMFLKGIVRGGRFRFRHIEFRGGHLPYPIDDTKQSNTFSIGGYYTTDVAPFQTSSPLRYKEGYIKHYYTKSFEEWIDKAKRGWPLDTDSLPFYRYFALKGTNNMPSNFFEKNLFLKDDWFVTNTKSMLEFLQNNEIVELARSKSSVYGFTSLVLYVMSQVSGKIILVKCEDINDFLFTIMLEYAFITDNKVIYCKNDNEVDIAYRKYRKSEESVYFWELI